MRFEFHLTALMILHKSDFNFQREHRYRSVLQDAFSAYELWQEMCEALKHDSMSEGFEKFKASTRQGNMKECHLGGGPITFSKW